MTKQYLNNIPADSDWLTDRERLWEKYLEEYCDLIGWSANEASIFEKYFFGGNLDEFVNSAQDINPGDILFLTPINNIVDYKLMVGDAISWYLNSIDRLKIKDRIVEDHNRFLTASFAVCLRTDIRNCLPDDLNVDIFFWIFGKTYSDDRIIELKVGDSSFVFSVDFDKNFMCHRLMDGIRSYLWNPKEFYEFRRFKSLIGYFLTIFPEQDEICFSKSLSSIEGMTDKYGDEFRKANLIWNRWLIASLNGIPVSYDIDNGVNEIVASDEMALNILKEGIKNAPMPKAYYELKKFVLANGKDSLKASEE